VGKRWTWVAWSLLVVFVLTMILAVILEVANGTFQHDAANQTLLFLGFGAFMAVGALVVAHRPDNAIGWIFSAIALVAFTGQLANEYATYAYATRSGSLPGAILAAWYASWPWWLVLTLALVFTPLAVPHRSAALAPLASGRLVGRGGDGGIDRADRPPGQPGHDRRPGDRQPYRGRLGGKSRQERGRRGRVWLAAPLARGRIRVAGAPVSAVAG
jgi:hypothetical protein